MSTSLTHELRRMGVHIREEWMAAARDHLRTNVANFDALPLDKQVSRVSAPLIRQSSPRGCSANEPMGTVLTPSLASYPRAKQVELVYVHFLDADMNLMGAGCLPDVGVRAMQIQEGSVCIQP
jgi:hypothetical protein